jgi:hypothetical protein
VTPFQRAGSPFLCEIRDYLVAAAWFDLELRAQLREAWGWVLEKGEG